MNDAPKPEPLAPRDMLFHLVAWLNDHLQRLSARGYSGEMGAKGNSWSVCEIPDWDARQRVAEIDAALAASTNDAAAVRFESDTLNLDAARPEGAPAAEREAFARENRRLWPNNVGLSDPASPPSVPAQLRNDFERGAWSRADFPARKDIIGVRELPDGRQEYLMHNEALCHPYYLAVSASGTDDPRKHPGVVTQRYMTTAEAEAYKSVSAPELGWRQAGDGGNVTITMTYGDYARLLVALSAAGAEMQRSDGLVAFYRHLALVNRLTQGDPNFTPFEIPEGYRHG